MIRRNRRYNIQHNHPFEPFPPSETSQLEPNLHDILVAYSNGQDVSEYIRMPASKATAEQQFTNRIGKVDPLTEISDYVKAEVNKANHMVAADNEKELREKSVVPPTDIFRTL